ncbi:response regulator [Desulfatiferula olefinivorans]
MKRLVVVERNPHIRRLLEREFLAEGYQVTGASNEHDLIALLNAEGRVDLVIIDPDTLDTPDNPEWAVIRNHYPDLPVIVLYLGLEPCLACPFGVIGGQVEKNWDSIGRLKRLSADILHEHHEKAYSHE